MDPKPPFVISLPRNLKGDAHALPGNEKSIPASEDSVNTDNVHVEKEKLFVRAYIPPDPGPYPQDQPKQNSVRFTATQVSFCYYLRRIVLLCILIHLIQQFFSYFFLVSDVVLDLLPLALDVFLKLTNCFSIWLVF